MNMEQWPHVAYCRHAMAAECPLFGGGFNWSAQHLLILRGEEVFHGDVTD